jgi:HK97 family phage major capsid protein
MNERARELRQQRADLIGQARVMFDKAGKEKRSMNADEKVVWDKHMADVRKFDDQIAEEGRKDQMAALEQSIAGGGEPQAGQIDLGTRAGTIHPTNTPEYRSAFGKFLSEGRTAAFTNEEMRALQASVAISGGNITAPQEFVKKLLVGLKSEVWMRQFATVFELTTALSMGIPTLDTDIADADWTTELATGSEGTLEFGKRELKPQPLAKRIKASDTLMRLAALPIEDIIRDRLMYKFAVAEEKAFLTGDGNGKPLGVFTPSANGIPVARDISAGNTATAITYDGLLATKMALKEGYRRSARWMFHSDAVLQILQLKDGNGQYVLNPNLPEADKILNMPYHTSDFAPNTFTTAQYVGLLGDFSHYWIADALDMRVQRLIELYAENNQIGFIGRKETDGQPVMGEAFARVKLG